MIIINLKNPVLIYFTDFSENFELVPHPDHENQRLIHVSTPLEGEVLRESNIHLIVTAEREHTSGASATVVLRLPEGETCA